MKYLRLSDKWVYMQIGTDGKYVEVLNVHTGSVSKVSAGVVSSAMGFELLNEAMIGCNKKGEFDKDFEKYFRGVIDLDELRERKGCKLEGEGVCKSKKKQKKKYKKGYEISAKKQIDFFMGF